MFIGYEKKKVAIFSPIMSAKENWWGRSWSVTVCLSVCLSVRKNRKHTHTYVVQWHAVLVSRRRKSCRYFWANYNGFDIWLYIHNVCEYSTHTAHTLTPASFKHCIGDRYVCALSYREPCLLACLSWHRVDLIAIDISSSYIPDTYYYIRVLSKHSFLIIYMTGDWSQVIVFDFPAKNIPFQFSLIPSNAVYSYRTLI